MSQPFHTQTSAFIRKVVQSLPAHITSAEMQHWIENPKSLSIALEQILVEQHHTTWKTFNLPPRTSEEVKSMFLGDTSLLRQHMEGTPNVSLMENTDEAIQNANLKDTYSDHTVETVLWTVEELGLGDISNVCLKDIRDRARLIGLDLPNFETALGLTLDLLGLDIDVFVPYLGQGDDGYGENYGGIISVGHPQNVVWFLEQDKYEDEPCSMNRTTQLVFVKNSETVDEEAAANLFSEELCSHFGADKKLRGRLLSLFEALAKDRKVEKISVRQLLKYNEWELVRRPNTGQKTISLLKQVLDHFGLQLKVRQR
jgi:hypothetical protein